MQIRHILAFAVVIILSYFSISQIFLDLKLFSTPSGQIRDVVQDYLASRALNLGQDPYQRLDKLHSLYESLDKTPTFAHPTPHTPYSIFIFSRFKFDNLFQAEVFWYFLQLLIFVGFFWFASAQINFFRNSLAYRTAFVFIMLGSDPVRMELILGQWNFILLVFILVHTYAHNKSWMTKSVCVSLTIIIKTVGLPHLLFDLMTSRVRSFLVFLGVFVVANLLLLISFEPGWVINYFTQIAPDLSRKYIQESANCSLLASIAAMLVVITNKEIAYNSYVPFVALSAIGIYLTYRARIVLDYDLRNLYLWTVSLLMLPIAWVHCLILIIPSIVKLVSKVDVKLLPDNTKIFALTLLFSWYFIRQPGLVIMEHLELNMHLVDNALSIVGVWLPILLVLVLIFIEHIDNFMISSNTKLHKAH